jgi:hypothetical protein
MKLYDGTIIPGNRHVGPEEVERRLATLYRPYHDAIATLAARRQDTVIVAIHSFTPCLRGRAPRPWHVGVLYSNDDDRLSRALIARLSQETDLCIGDNEPYAGALPGDAIDRHALKMGRHNTRGKTVPRHLASTVSSLKSVGSYPIVMLPGPPLRTCAWEQSEAKKAPRRKLTKTKH